MSSRELRPASPIIVGEELESDLAVTMCPMCQVVTQPVYKLKHTTVYECREPRCRLQFASPQLNDQELGRAYASLYYPAEDGRPAVLENATEFEVRRFLSAIEKYTGSLRGKRVLDYGCGRGALLKVASELGGEVIGIEQSATAREYIADSGYGRVYADLDAMQQTERRAGVDYVTMCDAVEHLREPWVDLAKLRVLLSPGGRLFMTTPNSDSLRSRLSGVNWDQRNNPTHFYYFNSQSLAKVVKRVGYSEVTQLPPITEYRHHGAVRRALQRTLARFGLHGGLLFMASR